MNWKSLRTGWTPVHFIHGGGWTDLHATDTRFRLTDRLELAMSLDSNFRVHSATKRSDAGAIAEKLGRLKSVQISDKRTIDGLCHALSRTDDVPGGMVLSLNLRGAHSFAVHPELVNDGLLVLRIVA